ncbi:hypothetical protein PUMCH_002141 [Australozyma saopauloensis]|uniref:Uncharacterized protein n=1 Tax=Australozyma saopauloensis TaxID=291208 RepID=A0AAX4H9B1_9ASCO|nr:hypothetical protein PUMCH_002141 [[Candida] saopauloensis]
MRVSIRRVSLLRHFHQASPRLFHASPLFKSQFFSSNDSTGEKSLTAASIAKSDELSRQCVSGSTHFSYRSFLDPSNSLPEVEITSPVIKALASLMTFKKVSLWQQVCQKNIEEPSAVGSVIEFHSGMAEIELGVVLQPPTSIFHHFHNRMIVLTMNNELKRVHPQDVTFVANEVFQPEWIRSLDIILNRFIETFAPRAELVQLVHYFLATSRSFSPIIDELSPRLHSHIASESGTAPVTILKLVNMISLFKPVHCENYLEQSAFLMAIHSHLCSDFQHWMVPGCMPMERTTNLSSLKFSNSIPYHTLYFATPLPVMSDSIELMEFDQTVLQDFNALASDILKRKPSFDDLTVLFSIWKESKFKPILNMIKFAIIYPHPGLLKQLANCKLLGTTPLTQKSLYDFMVSLGVYENLENAMTDPLLSSNLLASLRQTSLVASSVKDLDNTPLSKIGRASDERNFREHFQHLRKRPYFNDHVMYLLPGQLSMGVSLEKVSTRKYLINIHIVDPATKVTPSSSIFREWALNSAMFVNRFFPNHDSSSPLLPESLLKQMNFTETCSNKTADYFRVGDLNFMEGSKNLPTKFQSCMTVTFAYNPSLQDQLKNMAEKVSISFDNISRSKIIRLDETNLEASLLGESQPSLLKTFRLFNRAKPSEVKEMDLDIDDHQNLKFIETFLKIHFTLRNRNNATAVQPHSGSLIRKVHHFDEENGTIKTDLQLSRSSPEQRALFFKSETNMLLGALTAMYCTNNNVPVIFRNQNFADRSGYSEGEGIIIKHKNAFFPEFTAKSYSQTAFARDKNGYVSMPAAKFAYNHLDREQLETGTTGQNIGYGLENGYVNVGDPTENIEAFLNQLQILTHVHFKTVEGSLATDFSRYSHLKALGYQLHGSLDQSVLQGHTAELDCAQMAANYYQQKSERYWILRKLETEPEILDKYSCVVTRVHEEGIVLTRNNSSARSGFELRPDVTVTTSGYCEELRMEVFVVIPANSPNAIGTEIIAKTIVYVDAISGILVLE